MERPVADATDSLCPMSALCLFPPSKIATKNKQFNNFIFGDKIIMQQQTVTTTDTTTNIIMLP